MATMRFAAPRLGESRGKRQARKEAKEMAQVIDHTVTPSDGDVLTYEAASGKYAPAATARVATVHLSSTQLKALHTTPVELVPAPGAGRKIVPVGYVLARFTPGDTPYAAAGNLNIGPPDGGGGAQNDFQYSAFLGGWTNAEVALLSRGGAPANDDLPAATDNQPLLVGASAALTNGTGTVDVTVVYVVV